MDIFKFGGASVKNPEAVRKVGEILSSHADEPLVIVVSAMGKTTNALEDLIEQSRQHTHYKRLQELYRFHQSVAQELLGKPLEEIEGLFQELSLALREGAESQSHARHYDRIIAFGELASTKIVAAYLQERGLPAVWVSAYELIQTDEQWREARVNWQATGAQVQKVIGEWVDKGYIPITQGFIGATAQGVPTTLGREGSDYTAAILAYSLQAKGVTIWKDVPGVLNADPKRWPETALYRQLPYSDASEMTYYGASVIHPKTIRPLASKGIPLYVRSFVHPEQEGTCIGGFEQLEPALPAIILKGGQSLLHFDARDLESISQRHLAHLIQELSALRVPIHLMMNTAVSFSVCIDTQPHKIEAIKSRLSEEFHIREQAYLELVTLMWPTEELLSQCYDPQCALLTLRTHNRMQFVREETLGA